MMVLKFRAWIKTGIETYDYVKPMTIQQMIHSKKSMFSLKQLNDLVDFEQFTGLKDVNGKEIYEGDILLYQEDYGDGFFAPVIYGSENLYYPAFDLDWHYIPKSYFFESNAISEGVANDYLIVAGNLHENLELLEAQHDTRTD